MVVDGRLLRVTYTETNIIGFPIATLRLIIPVHDINMVRRMEGNCTARLTRRIKRVVRCCAKKALVVYISAA